MIQAQLENGMKVARAVMVLPSVGIIAKQRD
jgi:hypothetical protein